MTIPLIGVDLSEARTALFENSDLGAPHAISTFVLAFFVLLDFLALVMKLLDAIRLGNPIGALADVTVLINKELARAQNIYDRAVVTWRVCSRLNKKIEFCPVTSLIPCTKPT